MLYLLFNLGKDVYALPAGRIVQLLPNLPPKAIRGAPPAIAGSLSYRGQFLPIIDLVKLETGTPAVDRMSTRIIVTEVPIAERIMKVGLVLENATQTFECDPGEFKPFASSPRGLVQLLDPNTLLPAHIFAGFREDWTIAS